MTRWATFAKVFLFWGFAVGLLLNGARRVRAQVEGEGAVGGSDAEAEYEEEVGVGEMMAAHSIAEIGEVVDDLERQADAVDGGSRVLEVELYSVEMPVSLDVVRRLYRRREECSNFTVRRATELVQSAWLKVRVVLSREVRRFSRELVIVEAPILDALDSERDQVVAELVESSERARERCGAQNHGVEDGVLSDGLRRLADFFRKVMLRGSLRVAEIRVVSGAGRLDFVMASKARYDRGTEDRVGSTVYETTDVVLHNVARGFYRLWVRGVRERFCHIDLVSFDRTLIRVVRDSEGGLSCVFQ